jgi:hypothetical protein
VLAMLGAVPAVVCCTEATIRVSHGVARGGCESCLNHALAFAVVGVVSARLQHRCAFWGDECIWHWWWCCVALKLPDTTQLIQGSRICWMCRCARSRAGVGGGKKAFL